MDNQFLNKCREFVSLKNPLSGGLYFRYGVALFLLKYPLDYLLATQVFDKKWPLWIYFSIFSNPLFQQSSANPPVKDDLQSAARRGWADLTPKVPCRVQRRPLTDNEV